MLTVICGPVNSRRDVIFREKIVDAADQGAPILVIVPDQYSFESDKKLYGVLGAKRFNNLETAGFNRLAELIMRAHGKAGKRSAAENAKIIMMYKAIMRLRDEKDSHYYRASLEKSRFISEMLKLTSELIRCGVTPLDLRAASERVSGTLALKLYDVSKLFDFYLEELSNAGMRDDLSALTDALALAEEYSSFSGRKIFIDAFNDFTVDEYNMIRCMMRQGADVTVSLICTDDSGSDNIDHPFAMTLRTRTQLFRIAEELNVRTEQINFDEIISESKTIGTIDEFFSFGKRTADPDKSGLTVAAANDIYEEIEYVCAEIERLVRENKYSYSDIVVSSRQLSLTAPAIEGIFERYEIPYFIDRRTPAASSVIVTYLNSIFECVVSKEYRTPAIFRFLRSPLCPVLDIDITELEDYCITYNVDREMWLEPFGGEAKCSPRLDNLRRRIIEPFEKFKQAADNKDAVQICKAFFVLLDEVDLSRQVYSVVRRASGSLNETQLEFARINKQLWQSVLGVFNSINDDLGDRKLSLRKFYELFKLMVSQLSISSPPQKIDAVRCVSAESSRIDDVSVIFVIETNDGVFPAVSESGGIFTEREKQLLSELDLHLSDTALHLAETERFVVYQTLCMPKSRLYVLYSQLDSKGKLKEPSEIIPKLKDIFGGLDITHISDLPIDFFCTSYSTAYYKFLEHNKEKLVRTEDPSVTNKDRSEQIRKKIDRADSVVSIEQAISDDQTFSSKLRAFDTYKEFTDYRIAPSTAKELFYKDEMTLSPSRINDFYKCPFSFFLNKGLKLRTPTKIVLDQLHKGNYLHRCLESLMTVNENGNVGYNKNFVFYTEDQLKEKIHIAFLKYESEEIGGSYGKTAAFETEKALYEEAVLKNVKLIQEEFSTTLFEPAFFEHSLIKENGKSLLRLKLSDDIIVNISGTVDRADVFTDTDGKKYLKIVDYKTGDTSFSLEAIYNGLDLQLLIYLLAMTQNDYLPAGAVYSHIHDFSSKLTPEKQSEEAAEKLRLGEYKPDGLIVGSDNIINALSKAKAGAFLPFNLKKDNTVSDKGRQPVSEKFIRAAEEFAKRKILALAEKLAEGYVPASPIVVRKKDPCSYCDYYTVCGRLHRDTKSTVTGTDKEKCLKEINDIAAEAEGGNEDA